MSLVGLLTNPDSFPTGRKGHSKNITYIPDGTVSNFHFTKRVEWDISDQNADPTFLIGNDHEGNGLNDFWPRSGVKTYFNRIKIDVQRISKFLYNSPQGAQFLLRQGALQLLNPQENTRTFNAGVSLLAQIAAAGTVKFKRSGLIPTPVGASDLTSNINDAVSGFLGGSSFVTNLVGGDYLDIIEERNEVRETNYGLGDPSKPTSKSTLDQIIGDINPFKKKLEYNVSVDDSESKIDKVNYQKIFTSVNGALKGTTYDLGQTELKDFVNFKFEILKSDDFLESNVILFRAYLDSFTDNFSATHNEYKYNGRGEPFYTYQSFNRGINISFKIAAQTRHEMKPIYQKLNYLVAQTAPNYSATGRIRTPYMRLTMGDYFKRVPGVLKNASINWNTNYPWEIKLDKEGKDKEMKVLPHVLDISITYQPIHSFVPNNGINAPFIGIGAEKGGLNSWLPNSLTGKPEIAGDDIEPNPVITGCTHPEAMNFDPNAVEDDGSCEGVDESILGSENFSNYNF